MYQPSSSPSSSQTSLGTTNKHLTRHASAPTLCFDAAYNSVQGPHHRHYVLPTATSDSNSAQEHQDKQLETSYRGDLIWKSNSPAGFSINQLRNSGSSATATTAAAENGLLDQSLSVSSPFVDQFHQKIVTMDRYSGFVDSGQTASTVVASGGSAPTVPNGSFVTIKAKYGNAFIKFQFPASSGIDEFNQQVLKRLNLEVGSYNISYLDEDNDLILVLCDDDLRYLISSSTALGNKTLLMSLENK